MIENIIILIAAVILALLFYAYLGHYKEKSKKRLNKWAKENGYIILSCESRQFKTGPFFISSRTRSQPVFYVTLEDKDGTELTAWIKIGNALFGLLSDEVKVKWENT
jgi:hypothetical protein